MGSLQQGIIDLGAFAVIILFCDPVLMMRMQRNLKILEDFRLSFGQL